MVYGSAHSSSSPPEGRSKLSLAVAQASARLSTKNKASVIRSSGEPESSLGIRMNENTANHDRVARPTPQDTRTGTKRRGVHKNKASVNGSLTSPKKSSLLHKMEQQHGPASNVRIKATPLPTQPQKHFASMLLRKDQKPRAGTSTSEPSMPDNQPQPPIAYNQKPLVPKQNKPQNTSVSRHIRHNNMVQRKSHQRLILEQVAAKYFLSNNEKFSRYVGASYYLDDDTLSTDNFAADNVSSLGGGGSTTTPLGLAGVRGEWRGKEQKGLAEFLDIQRDNDDIVTADMEENESSTENDSPSAISSVDLESQSTREPDVILAESPRKTSTAQEMQDFEEETNIDSLLEIASNHLSLGKNDSALQAYRFAMKLAFADVMAVKNQLREIKRQQEELILAEAEQERKFADLSEYVESSALASCRKEVAEFELSLLEVASRVANIHNNMGVVHELNRSYNKAQASYSDALDVYYNTCKRIGNSDDPDVHRTKTNVKRMKKACASEEQRAALHDKATSVVKQTRSSDPTSRGKALAAAVIALKQALKIETETLGLTHPVAANTLIQMGKYYYEMCEYDEAVSVIRQAIINLQNALGKNHPQVCKAFLLLASIYERHGVNVSPEGLDKDDALLEIYVDALDPLKSSLGEVHTEIGLVYTKIGYLYGKKKEFDLSLLAYKAALKAYGEPASISLLGGIHPEVLSIWVCVTEHLHSMKSWDEVLVAGERALFFLRLAKKSLFRDATLDSNHFSSASSSDTGSKTSVPISIVKTSKKSLIQITAGTYYNALYVTLSSLADAHITLKRYQLARDASEESLQLAWNIALSSQHNDNIKGSSNEPLDPETLQLIRALKRFGKVILLQKHYNDALDCFMPCLEVLRSSKTTESTLDTASVLGSLGFLYLKLKRFNEAINFLRECLRLYRKNGIDENNRETSKIKAWLEMAESREEDFEEPPTFLEIPIVL